MKPIIHHLVLLVLSVACCAAGEPSISVVSIPTSVATAAGEPVDAEEVRLAMARRKAEVCSWFREHRGLEDQPGYWMDRGDISPSPILRLREMALADLKEMKALMRAARERGLVTDISHAGFLRELEQENARRREMASSGGIIYGPRQYSLPAYHSIHYQNTAYRLKQVLMAEAARTLTDKDVQEYQRAHPDAFNKGTPEQNREATLKRLRDEYAQRAMLAIVAEAEISVVDEAVFNAISPRIDKVEPSRP